MCAIKAFVFFLYASFFITVIMSSRNINDYFPDIKGNLTNITWAHAVNNKSKLNSVLNDSTVMMIEADIVLGTVNGIDKIPIMAHPPNNQSDLSLSEFLDTIIKFNKDKGNSTGKGIKLDFKSMDAFTAALSEQKLIDANNEKFPLWINADIVNATKTPTNPALDSYQFLNNTKKLPESVLSLGWTTANSDANYTDANIDDMLNVINTTKVTNDITFAVRACLTANSGPQMSKLVTTVKNSTLTIWSSNGDIVDVEGLRKVIFNIGLTRTFIDVPKELRSQLRLDSPPKGGAGMNTFTLSCLVLGALTVIL